MEKFGKSQPVKRFEDPRLITGRGGYVDDIAPAGALHAIFLRSSVAHGRITGLDLDEARGMPGVHLVLAADDLKAAGVTEAQGSVILDNRDGSKAAAPRYPLLAEGKVRFVGEPVAMIVAETLNQARDAAEAIVLDFDDLPAKLSLERGGETVHDEAPDNLAIDWEMGDSDACKAALASADRVVKLDVLDNRVIVNAMEPRGSFAEWDGDRIHLSMNGQGVWGPKRELARIMGLDPEKVRVTHPDVGGGFGMKTKLYAEYALCAVAARELGRPVRWMSDRTEAMLTDNAGRDLTHQVEMGFDADNKLVAYHVKSRFNLGAYNSNFGQFIQTGAFSRVFTGVYDVQAAWLEVEGYYTTTTPSDAYRGAGRPEAIFLLERSMDTAARALGVDRWELRKRNFIAPAKFPYRSIAGEQYDVGEFARVMDRAADFADRDGFAARREASAAEGKLRGIGLCYYIEAILGDPTESAKVEFNADGTASIFVGTQSNGQGHETVFAQFLSDQTGIPTDKIRVIQGDSDLIAQGGGTGGSRSVTTQTNATLATVSTIVSAFRGFLAEKMEVSEDKISFDDQAFRIEGSNAAPTMLDVAEWAREKGQTDLLVHEERVQLEGRSYPNGCHVAEVEIDPETGFVRLDRYNVVDDFGNLINPVLAEGQVHGGVAQGAGQVLFEHSVHDEDGQLLTATFMDYAMPRAADMPFVGFASEPVPSVTNPMGMKGCGEAGTVGSIGATANAVADALWDRGVTAPQLPFTPHRVWSMLNHAEAAE